ncbi:MAG TPA: hypothetical protein VF134_01680 [Candidatus Dormibacteraeota bacterium]
MLKFYPDHVPARVPRLFGDMLATLWLVVWAVAGLTVYQVVEGLQSVSNGITGTGRALDSWIASFRNAVPRGIPGVSNFFVGLADNLQHNSGDQLIQFGAQAHDAINTLALALGLITAVPPIAIVCGTYAALRWRDAREMGSALAFVRAAERGGRTEQAKAVLAYRAVAQLSFTQLMRASDDPIGDLAAHRYDPLAAAMLKRAGLESFRLYDPGARRLKTPGPGSRDVGGEGEDEDHRRAGTERQVRRLGSGEQSD